MPFAHTIQQGKGSNMLIECEKCHKRYSDEAAVCPMCGAPRDIVCHDCGVVYKSDRPACPNCGAKNPLVASSSSVAVQNNQSDESRVTAGVFAPLLGGLGIHEFYMGNAGIGVLMLLFCWTGIPSIIALIQGIIYLTESDQAFANALNGR